MKPKWKFLIIICLCLLTVVLAVGIGSVSIPPADSIRVLLNKLFNINFDPAPTAIVESIFWKIRLPRVLLAFITGSALAISGVVMQSVLRNPLASSYTLGISSGSAVGACLVILLGINAFGILTKPIFGLTFGCATVFLSIGLASKIDKNMENTTIILTGMAFSLFANAIITFMLSFSHEELKEMVSWQFGSFALKDWRQPAILFLPVLIGFFVLMFFSREMDVLTFGEEQASAVGVELKKTKWILLSTGAIVTGCAVSLCGIIGFIDLFTPHVARRIFGSSHRQVIPASALLGGMFTVLCDLVARTIVAPQELPVGAVSALIGAPFFIYLYFGKRKKV